MSSYRRRVLALEQAARIVNRSGEIDAAIQADWPEIERIARDLNGATETVVHEVRCALSDPDVYDRELSAELGIPIEEIRDPDTLQRHIDRMERDRAEWQERRRQEQAQVISWRGGVKYRGGEPVTD